MRTKDLVSGTVGLICYSFERKALFSSFILFITFFLATKFSDVGPGPGPGLSRRRV